MPKKLDPWLTLIDYILGSRASLAKTVTKIANMERNKKVRKKLMGIKVDGKSRKGLRPNPIKCKCGGKCLCHTGIQIAGVSCPVTCKNYGNRFDGCHKCQCGSTP